MPSESRETREQTPSWLTKGVWGIGLASFLADVGHEVPTALFASLVTITLGAPAAALGLIEGLAEGLAGLARFVGGTLSDDPRRRRSVALGGYLSTAALASLIGAAVAVWQVALLRMAAWTSRGLRVPARNALLADMVAPEVYGRAYGFERMMDNLGAVGRPLLALGLVALTGVRWAIGLSVIPGLLAALSILYAIRHIPVPPHANGFRPRSRCALCCGAAWARYSWASASLRQPMWQLRCSSCGPPNSWCRAWG